MAIPEACGLWIEQRIQEELEQQGETGTSLRAIGRQVAAEVEKYFETKVNPRTIEKRAERSATNVAPAENPTAPSDSDNLEKLEKTWGGPRRGSGRKPRIEPEHDQPPKKEDDEPLSNWREKSNGQQAGKDDLEKQAQCTEAYQFETIAISQLKRIRKEDPDRVGALNRVKKWIESQLLKG